MARVIDILQTQQKTFQQKTFSIEILPPERYTDVNAFHAKIDSMVAYDPLFMTIVYHQQQMKEVVHPDKHVELLPRKIRASPDLLAAFFQGRYPNIPIAPHFICGGFTKSETESAVIQLPFAGIENIILIRGDPNHGDIFKSHPEGHKYASELIEQITRMRQGKYLSPPFEGCQPINLCVGAAIYPEKHYASANLDDCIEKAKIKQEKGADYFLTQLCFDNDAIIRLRDLAVQKGITIPIIPGIKILDSTKQLTGERSIPARFGASIPEKLRQAVLNTGIVAGKEWAVRQAEGLYAAGFSNVHFYTQNKPETILPVLDALGFR